MQLHEQKRGPISSGDSYTISSQTGIVYIHIGIQIPKRQPIQYEDTSRALSTELSINGTRYRVNDTGILEFDDISERSLEIVFYEDLPWETIVDFVYDTTTGN